MRGGPGTWDGVATEDRFWRKVNKTDSCWLWTASTRWHGYGQFSWYEKDRHVAGTSHRYSWKLHHGEIPEGMWILHRCDNPSCVNPDHLFLGTHQDNMDDMRLKGRGTTRLSPDIVWQIRNEVRNGTTHRVMARRLGVDRSTISLICSGKRWKHVGDEIPDDIGDWLPGFKASLSDSKESTTLRGGDDGDSCWPPEA